MIEKPSASNKVFLIRQLVNTKMKEGASIEDHVNEFNSILSRLMSVDIRFDDEVQALLLLSSLPESWSGIITAVSGSTRTTKLKFDNIRDLILGEDIRRKTSGEYSNYLLSEEDKDRGGKQDRGQKQNRGRSKSKKKASKDKEVHMAVRDYNEALVCCVENTVKDSIMDFGASFHATFCKEELEKFRLRSGLKRSQNKRGSLYMVEVPSDRINATIDGKANAALWHQRLGHMSEKGMKILASKGRVPYLQKAVVGICEPCVLWKQKKVSFVKSWNTRKLQRLELVHTDVYGLTSVASIGGSRYYVTFTDDSSRMVLVYFLKNKYEVFNTFKKLKAAMENETNLWVKRLKSDNGGEYSSQEINRTLSEREKSMRLHAGLPKKFWEDSVTTTTYLINRRPFVPSGFRILEEEWQGIIVAEHGLSSKFTQIPCGSSDTSEGSENYRSFEDNRRSNEEDTKDIASSYEGGSETFHVRRSTRESKALVRYSPSTNYLIMTKNGKPESYSKALNRKESIQWKKAINEEISSLEMNQTWSLVRLPAGKKVLHSKWVLRVKEEHDGSKRYKARLVVKGFQQKQGGFLVSWERRKPHVQVEEKSVWIKASTETMAPTWQRSRSSRDNKTKGTLRISQEKYLWKVLEKFNMKDAEARCEPLGDHFKLIGSVMYVMVCTRPNIAHVVEVVSRFKSNPGKEHWEVVKWLLRYLKGTSKATLCFSRKEVVLEGFFDSHYGGYLDSGKSTMGYIFIVDGTIVSWMSRIQKCVAMSTTEAKYMAIVEAGKELMTFGGNTRDLGSFREKTDKITDLHQIHEEVLFTKLGDGIAGIKLRRRDASSDGVRDLATASGRGQLKEDLESST
ncbi:retrovirus-related pol polyprotein from transposon TNT 1-94 [Tanacetum coccineum]